ncbi:probable flavin oxidoreductase [Rhodococcus jostii RHA1]|uniref:Probable flavin oxidoreductase n=1 Tax=Rhodococcus jostii (strain RHA1) TaxID=101510 RepID=Q0S8F8_RHOJR|nr:MULTISPECIES: flavin reductase family protein [Rhodococcus]ABG96178.1 probable flavin oxidoreductase [Rhodococcus jostii RHA1]EJI96808.1 flavin reductase [Rhodococcus sp. JVH1]
MNENDTVPTRADPENDLSDRAENAETVDGSDLPRDPHLAPGIGAEDYRAALRRHPAGVTIVTLDSGSGPVGFTASSFSSVSLDPPLVSFNIANTSSSIDALHSADSLVIHLLGEHQQHLAQRFSRSADQRFADESLWARLDTGEPVLHGTPSWLRVIVDQLIPVGDHTLVIGLVTRVHAEADDDSASAPLLYHEGRYYRPTPLGSANDGN